MISGLRRAVFGRRERMDKHTLRRSDRQVVGIDEILGIIGKCRVIRLAMSDIDGELYIVPLNFGFDFSDGRLCFYAHSAKSGRKLDIIAANPSVAFELDCDNGISCGELPCSGTCFYESVTGTGSAELIDDTEEKSRALRLLMKNTAGRDFEFTEDMVKNVAVIKVTANRFTCKRHEGRGAIK